jgi:hypothetical protein
MSRDATTLPIPVDVIGNWHHIVITYDLNVILIYVNGARVARSVNQVSVYISVFVYE